MGALEKDLFVQVGEQQRIGLGERVIGPQQDQIGQLVKRHLVEPVGDVHRSLDDDDVEPTIERLLDQFGRGAADDRQLQSGQAGRDFGQHRIELRRPHAFGDAQVQRRDLRLADALGRRLGRLRRIQRPLQMRQHLPAEIGEVRARPLAPEQQAAKLVLQLLDRAGERRLRHVALVRRAREVQRPGHGQEIADLMHLHS
jgi:hypothetical protein